LLITAVPSGVGVTALVLGKYLGAQVIGTSRSTDKLERLKPCGLDAGVVTGSNGFGAAITSAIGEKGVDMIVDNIGGDVLAPCIEALAVGGRYVTIGRMSGVLKGELDVDRRRPLSRVGLRTPQLRLVAAELPQLGGELAGLRTADVGPRAQRRLEPARVDVERRNDTFRERCEPPDERIGSRRVRCGRERLTGSRAELV